MGERDRGRRSYGGVVRSLTFLNMPYSDFWFFLVPAL